jgi:hypothetical protein
VFGLNGSGRIPLGQSAALYCRVSTADQTFRSPGTRTTRLRKKAGYRGVGVWKETASGKAGARQTQEGLGFGAVPKVDAILVTELTRWGWSPAGFAARSVTCFKFRFVSSPLVGLFGCDGSKSVSGAPKTPGTTTGNYQVIVTAASGTPLHR